MTDETKEPSMGATERHTAVQRALFLEAVGTGLSITGACKATGVARATVYGLWLKDRNFREEYGLAVEQGTQVMEDEARRRAVEGFLRPVYQGGKHVGDEQVYSDRLMEFLLRARRPTVYRNSVNLSSQTPQATQADNDEVLVQYMLELDRAGGGIQLPAHTVARLVKQGLLPAEMEARFVGKGLDVRPTDGPKRPDDSPIAGTSAGGCGNGTKTPPVPAASARG